MTNDELAAVILPWAKETMPEAYEATLEVANRPQAFRNYLTRLIERRWEREPQWRTSVPLDALEATGITARLRAERIAGGVVLEVKGARAGVRQWGFGELAALLENGATVDDLRQLHELKQSMDLVLDEPASKHLPEAGENAGPVSEDGPMQGAVPSAPEGEASSARGTEPKQTRRRLRTVADPSQEKLI